MPEAQSSIRLKVAVVGGLAVIVSSYIMLSAVRSRNENHVTSSAGFISSSEPTATIGDPFQDRGEMKTDTGEETGEETGEDLESHPLLPPEVPDTPHEPRAPAFSTEFEEQLHRAAKTGGGSPDVACLEWGRILPFVLRNDATEDEKSLGLFNVARACSEGELQINDLRLGREAILRYRTLDSASEEAVRKYEELNPGQADERSFILFVDAHVTGTKAYIDGAEACTEPCALAIPLDGEAHLLNFENGAAKAALSWRPSSLGAEPPLLPPLQ